MRLLAALSLVFGAVGVVAAPAFASPQLERGSGHVSLIELSPAPAVGRDGGLPQLPASVAPPTPSRTPQLTQGSGASNVPRRPNGYYGLPTVVDGYGTCVVLGNLAGIDAPLLYAYALNTTNYVDWQYVYIQPFVLANNTWYAGALEAGGWINEQNHSVARGNQSWTIPLASYHPYVTIFYRVWWYDWYTGGQWYQDADWTYAGCQYL